MGTLTILNIIRIDYLQERSISVRASRNFLFTCAGHSAEKTAKGKLTMMSRIGKNHGQHAEDYNNNDTWHQFGYPQSQSTSTVNEFQHFLPTHSPLPLIMPSQPTWPSTLSNPADYMASPEVIPHTAPPTNAPKLPIIQAASTRKRLILTNKDRRRISQLHTEHPLKTKREIRGELRKLMDPQCTQ